MANHSPIVGIDLGTTYCCVAYLPPDDHVSILENPDGQRITPSYVAFTKNEEIIGACAKDVVFESSENVIYDTKRLIGRKFSDKSVQANLKNWTFKISPTANNTPMIEVSVNGATVFYKPHEISAKILRYMKNAAEEALETKITNAVITAPAYFNHHQRNATKEAGKLAGLNVLKIINEPTAAGLAYIHKHKITDCSNMVVFDLGGGTLDVSVLKVYRKSVTIRATSGNTYLGGRDFDNNLADFIMEEIKNKYGKNVEKRIMMPLINAKCEHLKKVLSIRLEAHLDFPRLFGDEAVKLKVRRESFEKVNMHLFERCIQTVKNCLQDARIDKNEVEKILLVGGSIRIPKLQEMLKEFFQGKDLSKAINSDEAVAYGAAVLAATFSRCNKIEVSHHITEVTPLSLGTDILGDRMSWLIPRNTPIPVIKTLKYLTTSDEQTSMCFNIYEGERSLAKFNTKLGTTAITLPPKPPGYCVNVTFEIDEDGFLKVKTKAESGIYTSLIIEYNHDFLKIDDILQDAHENRLSDSRKCDVIAQWSKLMEYCVKMKAICRCNKKGIKEEEKKSIMGVSEEGILWLNNNQVVDGSKEENRRLINKQEEIWGICEPIVNEYGYKIKNMHMLEFNKLIDQ